MIKDTIVLNEMIISPKASRDFRFEHAKINKIK